MCRTLSLDLRQRTVGAYRRGEGTQVQIASRFGIGEDTLRRCLRRDEAGSLAFDDSYHHGPTRTIEVASEADAASVRDLHARWVEWQPTVLPARLVFLDESGLTVAMTRTHARAPRGESTADAVPRNRGSVTTILSARTMDGLDATMTIEGGTDREVFVAYVEQVLLPILCTGDLVVTDNAAAHKDARVKALLESVGAKPVYLPPYSPELNPIEFAGSKLKAFLRTAKARTVEALNHAIVEGMRTITPQNAAGWFRHCGYTGHPT